MKEEVVRPNIQEQPSMLAQSLNSSAPPIALIVRARPADIDRAVSVLKDELLRFSDYDRVGYGWAYGGARGSPRFFVRRTKDGLSCTALYKDGAGHG